MQNISGLASFNLDEALTCGWTLSCENYQPDLLHFTRDGHSTILKGYYASFQQASERALTFARCTLSLRSHLDGLDVVVKFRQSPIVGGAGRLGPWREPYARKPCVSCSLF